MRIYTGKPAWYANPYLRPFPGALRRAGGLGLGDLASTQSLITQTSSQYGVPADLALAVAQKESGFNQAVVGTSGEVGVFQLMPGTATQLGVDPSDLGQNVQGGISYLASLYKQFGNWSDALMAYNGGPGNVTRGSVSPAAQNYASSILGGLSSGSLGIPASSGTDLSSAFDYSGADSSDAWLIGGLAVLGLAAIWAFTR